MRFETWVPFQVNLPAKWNGKAVHMGGGGFNGTVVTGQGAVSMGLAGVPPLSQGYATFGSDSGHQDPTGGPSFAANDEALLNYGALHLKKTLDVATDIIARIASVKYWSAPACASCIHFSEVARATRSGLICPRITSASPITSIASPGELAMITSVSGPPASWMRASVSSSRVKVALPLSTT